MRNADELAKRSLDSPEGHRKAAITLKRLIGGIATQYGQAGLYDLDEEEMRTLLEAETILSKMASIRAGAVRVKKEEQAKRAKREAEAEAAIKNTFASITIDADKLALIRVTSPTYFSKLIKEPTRWNVDYYFKESLESIVYRLGLNEADIKTSAQELWDKFQALKHEQMEQMGTINLLIEQLNREVKS